MADHTHLTPSPAPSPSPMLTPSADPGTPGLPGTPQTRSSPSFDYHEERRLHLKDEIYFSHHLPRHPPPSLPDSPQASTAPLSTSLNATPLASLPAGPSRVPPLTTTSTNKTGDPSPSAFHPRKLDNSISELSHLSLGNSAYAHAEEDGGGSGMLSPSGPEDGDMDPAGMLIHRTELDDQERLDLEEEKRERELSEAGVAGQPSLVEMQTRGKAAAVAQENGIGSELDALYAAFAKCLDLRDKYLSLSNQRLGDNPRDHDGSFHGFQEGKADVSGLKADVNPADPFAENPAADDNLSAWKIYPAPPPPHWHWTSSGGDGAGPSLEHRDSTYNALGMLGGNSVDAVGSAGEGDGFDFKVCSIPGSDDREFDMNDEGVYVVYGAAETPATGTSMAIESGKPDKGKARQQLSRVPNLREYFSDLDYLLGVCSDGPAKSFAFRRLKYLASKWSLYCLLNEYQELADMKAVPHRDFYNVRKVDTHIHHSASMNQKHLLRFIKSKLKKAPNEIVIHRDGKDLTLAEVFESLNLTAYDLSIDTLDMHAHQEFHRFDRFNDRYNPTGSSRLREIFLKTDNLLKGKYLAELTKELITDLEQSKYQQVEWRLSIYGRNINEWDKLAKWVIDNKLISHNVRWLIQVPRLYEVFKGAGLVNCFEDVVKNVFEPLFEVTKDPSSHPELHVFLQRVVGFDSVDDESKPERRLYRKFPTAKMWDTNQSPPYSYWIYYMYANMASLNAWRRARGFNTFVLRPHCGEAGDPDHLSSAFLCAHSISHGILLRKVPALQYLFYLKQIGLAMSPLSNNALFLTYERNPFKDFFRTGLNVSLSTDDPLQFHFTASHLLEEYSCAAQIYKLTPADMCELARNSVLQSGWEMQVKKHWIGHKWYLPGAAGNDIHKTNVPTIRLAYRHATLIEELALIRHGTHSPSATPTHLKPSVSNAPAISTSPKVKIGDRPGLTSRPSDVGAAAMAVTNAVGGYDSSTSPHLVAGVGSLEERQMRKRRESLGAKSHEIRR